MAGYTFYTFYINAIANKNPVGYNSSKTIYDIHHHKSLELK